MGIQGYKLTPAPEAIMKLARKLFGDPERHGYGDYHFDDRGEEIIEHTLYSFGLRSSKGRVRLQLFTELKSFGGELWSREVRTLQQISMKRSSGVSEIIGGGVVEEDNCAFVLTRSYLQTLASDDVLDHIRKTPLEAINHFAALADALSLMHENGLAHRNLWHGVIEYNPKNELEPAAARLSRFEMSLLVTNLLLLASASPDQDQSNYARQAILRQPSEAFACFAPERLGWLAADGANGDFIETERSDVYSLGMIAWQMFVSALPQEAAALIRADGTIHLEAARNLRKICRNEIDRVGLPTGIKNLIHEMLKEDWKERPSSSEICTELVASQTRYARHWLPRTSGKAYQVVFIPADFKSAPIVNWNWLEAEPGGDFWTDELRDFMTDDIRGGEITYSPDGYPGSEGGRARDAKYVFIGKRAIWYCAFLRENFGTGKERSEILLIRFADRRESDSGQKAALRQPIASCPEIEVADIDHQISSMAIDEIAADRPTWNVPFDPLKGRSMPNRTREQFRQALDFLIDYQDANLLARYYAYKKVRESGRFTTIRFDEQRDSRMRDLYGKERRLHAYIGAYRGSYRPPFGPFFTSESTFDGAKEVVFSLDNSGVPRAQAAARGTVRRSGHLEELEIELTDERGRVPEFGWLRPADDFANAVNLERQREAKEEFLQFATILEYLIKPYGIAGPRWPWAMAGLDLRYPKEDSIPPIPEKDRDDNQRYLIDMLRLTPLYLLMGPPGTGKTTTVATAVAAYLNHERSARVLLSAQSHFALDNLGEKLLTLLPADTIVIRATTRDSEGKVSQAMLGSLPSAQARKLIAKIKTDVPAKLKDYGDAIAPEARQPIEEWLARIDASQAELAERLMRGASVVLATTSAATPATLGFGARVGVFDWVIVEEVAKAWITEIAIPLVRGYRWALVGDPEQLPAHRREDIDRLLDELNREEYREDAILGKYAENRERIKAVFDFFKLAFDPEKQGDILRNEKRYSRTRAAGQLTRQFRMRKPIGDLISEAFYEMSGRQKLQTPPEAERPANLSRPSVLASDHPLVWMDTTELENCREEAPYWHNTGEAGLIRDMLAELTPWPISNAPNHGPETLAVLTPYNQQRDRLISLIDKEVLTPRFTSDPRVLPPGSGQHLVHNVHTVQGREFDIVLVSLVRTGDSASPNSTGLGFLEWPYLINVLFSRARRQLVVFGDFDYYRKVSVPHWKTICGHFAARGKVVRLRAAGSEEGW